MIEYLDLADYLLIAEAVTETDAEVLSKLPNLQLADSALHSPQAGFDDVEFYPEFERKAAVLMAHLLWNHPLPDGNKRTAWVCMREFVARNGFEWTTAPVDECERFVLDVVTKNVSVDALTDWIAAHIRKSKEPSGS